MWIAFANDMNGNFGTQQVAQAIWLGKQRAAFVTLFTAALVACQSGDSRASGKPAVSGSPNSSASMAAPVPWLTPTCAPASAVQPGSATEVEGRASPAGAQLWGLVAGARLPLHAGPAPIKIVWRMTGTGPLQVVADGPRGAQTAPTFLDKHSSSSWTRPGDERGTGIVFNVPGCWEVHLWRDDTNGSVSFVVT
jgi:hypothetical protein